MSNCCEELKDAVNALTCKVGNLNDDIDSLWDEIFSSGKNFSFAFAADTGDATTAGALDLAARLTELDALEEFQAFIAGGDNNYPDGEAATIGNWAPFQFLIDKEKVFPAIGNHDLGNIGIAGQPHLDKFPYLPNNGRYYVKSFPDASVDFFILNSGLQTDGTLVEADGNTIGSDQYNWFISAVANSNAKFKIVVIHHPFSSLEDGALSIGFDYVTYLDWGFEEFGICMILNGHSHAGYHLRKQNTAGTLDIVNTSAIIDHRWISPTILGVTDDTSVIWAYAAAHTDGPSCYTRITSYGKQNLLVEIVRCSDGIVLHAFIIS